MRDSIAVLGLTAVIRDLARIRLLAAAAEVAVDVSPPCEGSRRLACMLRDPICRARDPRKATSGAVSHCLHAAFHAFNAAIDHVGDGVNAACNRVRDRVGAAEYRVCDVVEAADDRVGDNLCAAQKSGLDLMRISLEPGIQCAQVGDQEGV